MGSSRVSTNLCGLLAMAVIAGAAACRTPAGPANEAPESTKMEPSTYQRASALLQAATAAEAAGDRATAMKRLQEGIDAIGDAYVSEDTLDETDMRLLASADQERKGNLEGAYRLRRSVLENRLALLQAKQAAGR